MRFVGYTNIANSLNQISTELKSIGPSKAQRRSIDKRIGQLPGEQAAQVQGLNAQKNQAFEHITEGARSKGLGFSGIPLGEQAEFSATQYAPALANLQSQTNDRRAGLFDQLYSLDNNILQQSIGIRENELSREAADRNSARAAAASSSNHAGIIEGLREWVSTLTQGGGGAAGGASQNVRGLIQAENNPNVFLDPNTGQVANNPFIGGNSGPLSIQNDLQGRNVITGNF